MSSCKSTSSSSTALARVLKLKLVMYAKNEFKIKDSIIFLAWNDTNDSYIIRLIFLSDSLCSLYGHLAHYTPCPLQTIHICVQMSELLPKVNESGFPCLRVSCLAHLNGRSYQLRTKTSTKRWYHQIHWFCLTGKTWVYKQTPKYFSTKPFGQSAHYVVRIKVQISTTNIIK